MQPLPHRLTGSICSGRRKVKNKKINTEVIHHEKRSRDRNIYFRTRNSGSRYSLSSYKPRKPRNGQKVSRLVNIMISDIPIRIMTDQCR